LIFSATITTTGGSNNVSPAIGGNAGNVTVNILGQNFSTSTSTTTTVVLRTPGQPDIAGISPQVLSTSQIETAFDLLGASPGVRDLIVTQTGTQPVTFPGSFTIQVGGSAQIGISVLGPSNVRAGRQATFDVVVSNTGIVDAPFVSVQASDPVSSAFGPGAAAQALGCALPSQTTYVSAMRVQIFPLTCTPQGSSCATINASAQKNQSPRDCSTLEALVQKLTQQLRSLYTAFYNLLFQLNDLKAQFENRCLPAPGPQDAEFCIEAGIQIAILQSQLQFLNEQITQVEVDLLIAQSQLDICLRGQQQGNSSTLTTTTATSSSTASVPPTSANASLQFCGVTPVDPNAKLGVSGAGQAQYVTGGVPLAYTVLFENLPAATAAASQVVVTDTLDAALDPSTVSINSIRFGATDIELPPGSVNFTVSQDLRPNVNLIVEIVAQLAGSTLTVTFTSLDPATYEPPNDLRGFLPPDTSPPAGEGSISFTVKPKNGLATGMQIRNAATVVFDTNAPINTPTWLNTIDNTNPTSSVTSLGASQNSPNFTVQWQGADVGSGLRDFTIYSSRDGGSFVPWLINTTLSQATFTGQVGHAYRFYSIARDAVGNIENAKSTPEATTTVQAGIPGDLNGDGRVDCTDIAIVKAAFGTSAGDPKYDVRADVNGDGVVDIRDLAYVSQHLSPVRACP